MAEIVDKIESIPVDTGRSKVAETPTQKDKRLRGALLTDLIKQHRDLVESYTNDSGECFLWKKQFSKLHNVEEMYE